MKCPLDLSEGVCACQHLHFRLIASKTDKIDRFYLCHQICGNLLLQPEETDTTPFLSFLTRPTLTYLTHSHTKSHTHHKSLFCFSFSPLSSLQTVIYYETSRGKSQRVEFIIHLFGESRSYH